MTVDLSLYTPIELREGQLQLLFQYLCSFVAFLRHSFQGQQSQVPLITAAKPLKPHVGRLCSLESSARSDAIWCCTNETVLRHAPRLVAHKREGETQYGAIVLPARFRM